ncbi:MAG TPA: hypothetical protein VFI11_05125 [Anaerolineales bacterium]|nr:hypothetical protein [Anaerolineales bacterium]
MSSSISSHRPSWSSRLLGLLLPMALLAGPVAFTVRPDWQGVDNGWAVPVNLSRSGTATRPLLLIDPSGVRHVIWEDLVADSAYSRGEGDEWAAPLTLETPIQGATAVLLSGPLSQVSSLWIDQDGNLLFKRMTPGSLGTTGTWQSGLRLATSVVAFDAVMDAQNRVHLGFIRASDDGRLAPGAYYMASNPGAEAWGEPKPLYLSDYYRSFLDPQAGGDINQASLDLPRINLAVGPLDGATVVHAAWDNPALKRVFRSRSADSGLTWEDAAVIDGPSNDAPYASAQSPAVSADGPQAVMVWKVVESGGSCRQLFEASVDGGETWSTSAPFLEELGGCPDSLQTFQLDDGITLYFATFQSQTFLVARDRSRWSLPQPQPDLNYFVDPETYEFVELGCRQANVSDGRVYVVGCDLGAGGDVWITSRSLSDVKDWFEPQFGWMPRSVGVTDPGTMLSIAAVSDSQGVAHVVWSEGFESESGLPESRARYAKLDVDGIAGPFGVQSELHGSTTQLDMLALPGDRMLAMWVGGEAGQLFLSRAMAAQAGSASGWQEPEPLPVETIGRWPGMAVGSNGIVYAVYSVPVNEQRGVYVLTSEDQGQTWSDPARVFDGVAGACELVDAPRLAVAGEDDLHVVWTCSTLPGGVGPLAVSYARSSDGGASWSDPVQLVARPVVESRLVAAPDGEVHLIWEEMQPGQVHTAHIHSTDGGATWSAPSALTTLEGGQGALSLEVDRAGRLHLLQLYQASGKAPALRYSIWVGSRWRTGASLVLEAREAEDVGGMTTTLDSRDRLVVAYLSLAPAQPDGTRPWKLIFATLGLDLGRLPAPTPMAALATPATETPTPQPAATQAPTVQPTFPRRVEGIPSGGGLMMALVIGGASTLVVLGAAAAIRRRPTATGADPTDRRPPFV